jgi:hypothetical protein
MTTNLGVAFGPQIAAAAARHNLDPRLLAAVAAQETGGPGSDSGRNIVGDGGHGHGVFQIDDRWHAFARTAGAMDPGQNADYAAGILSSNLRRYGGDVHAALSAYNAGSPTATGTRTDWGDGKPLGYADSVLRHLSRLTGGGAASAVGAAASAALPAAETAATAATSTEASSAEGSGVNALQSLFQALTGGGGAGSITLSLPQYQPMNKPDERDQRDLAPSATDTSDDDAS